MGTFQLHHQTSSIVPYTQSYISTYAKSKLNPMSGRACKMDYYNPTEHTPKQID